MKLAGHLCQIGLLVEMESDGLAGEPAMQIRLRDGRLITIAGLTEAECREAAPMFLDGVVLTIERGPK